MWVNSCGQERIAARHESDHVTIIIIIIIIIIIMIIIILEIRNIEQINIKILWNVHYTNEELKLIKYISQHKCKTTLIIRYTL